MFLFVLANVFLFVLCACIFAFLTAHTKQKSENTQLEKGMPKARDGMLVSAMAIEIVDLNGKEIKGTPLLVNLFADLEKVVQSHGVKPVGSFQSIFMAVSTDDRVGQESLVKIANCSVALRDRIREFAHERGLEIVPKFGVHSDLIPSVGMGSTIGLSQLWNTALNLADQSLPNVIQLSDQSTEWIGDSFDFSRLTWKPLLS